MTAINKKAFTLIELLVVVLITGILAAIALPQYQKAVQKSRAYTAVQNVKALAEANRLHKLVTGQYTTDMDKLDITLGNDKYFDYKIYNDAVMHIMASSEKPAYKIIYFAEWPTYPQYQNKILCRASPNTDGAKVCQNIGRDLEPYAFSPGLVVSFLN
jgi:type IV pilus assembly protein PilE